MANIKALRACRPHNFVSTAILIICLAVWQGCAVQKPADPTKIDVGNYKGRKIIVGTEGGPASLRNETIILVSGEMYYHNNFVKDYKYLKTLNKTQKKAVFKLANNPALPHEGFNHPGNMSTFFEKYNHQKLDHKYVWGEPGVEVPEGLDQTYSGIINIIK
jgi:hypothetical protein